VSKANDVFQELFADLGGCDNSCIIRRPKGMGTNGGCRCSESEIRRALQRAKAEILRLRGICTMCESLRGAQAGGDYFERIIAKHEADTGHTVIVRVAGDTRLP
jgi:hypothetical protein